MTPARAGAPRRTRLFQESEDNLKNKIIGLAMLTGWKVHHCRPARTEDGWRTPIQGHKGFVDLVLAHPNGGPVLFRELKSNTGTVTSEQQEWIDTLTAAGADVGVWAPRDWDEIEALLKARRFA